MGLQKCNNCGNYGFNQYNCYTCEITYCDHCNCNCTNEISIFKAPFSYGLNEHVEINKIYYIYRGSNIPAAVCLYYNVWFEIKDQEFVDEISEDFVKYPKSFDQKDYNWLAENYKSLPKIKCGKDF